MRVLLAAQFLFTAVSSLAIRAVTISDELNALLTDSDATVNLRARWSTYNAPDPAVVVNVRSECDVAAVVKYCTDNDLPFLAQNGGNGWANTFNLGQNGVLINLAGLNAVTVSEDKTEATIGGGAVINETIQAANAAGVLVLTGNCNCVGAIGAMLGGGFGNLMGEVGQGVDTILSMRVVVASGDIIDVSPDCNPDLFWAMRGAGPNFGIVTSATVRARPATDEERTAFMTTIIFTGDKVAEVAQAVEDLPLTPEQVVFLILANPGPPLNAPAVIIQGFLHEGTEEDGREAFAPIYDLGPVFNVSSVAPYTGWNAPNDNFCSRGVRRPAYSAAIDGMHPENWEEIFELFSDFQAKAPTTSILIERYNMAKSRRAPEWSASFQQELRELFAQAIIIPSYNDSSLDAEANVFGKKVRDIFRFTDENPTYINFAHGDESLEEIFGNSLDRLREVKAEWDPTDVFNQWFNIDA
ncbi:FAD binding domain-containing protein [Colletotrichum musicola]|uniref:FAD binding domain-containing protein n=1 Tax=Colletotrichum musicola TaxID=2175873 RepID=A0A8H6KNF2_9PEZI|nr:FAD binding domain-containing protein [Colletotrichum musicola]